MIDQVEQLNSTHLVPRTIAVDLTPLLPGGENGGAKVFAVELVRELAKAHPQARFLLLTQAVSHEELAPLDRDNVRRLMVVGEDATSMRSQAFESAAGALRRFPQWTRRRVASLGYRLHARLKRNGARGLLRRESVDLLFCPFTAPTFRERGIPTVSTVYDLQYRVYPRFFGSEDWMQRHLAFAEASSHATLLAAISDFTRRAAIAEANLDPARIRTIPIAVGRDDVQAGVDDALDRLGLRRGEFFFYPANFWKHKNHEMLLTAFAIACKEGLPRTMKLACTGTSDARQDWLAAAARKLGLGDRVVFAGFMPRPEMLALLSNSRAMIFPSLYEGFGLPLVEAMAAGIAVACGNLSALPETAGDAALLFDPRSPVEIAKAMVALASDEAQRARLIEAGKRRAAAHADNQRMAREYWELFESALRLDPGPSLQEQRPG